MSHIFDLVARWDASAKKAPSKAQKVGDEVSAEERARRVAEYQACAPNADVLDALELGILGLRAEGKPAHVHREGRGRYVWFADRTAEIKSLGTQ